MRPIPVVSEAIYITPVCYLRLLMKTNQIQYNVNTLIQYIKKEFPMEDSNTKHTCEHENCGNEGNPCYLTVGEVEEYLCGDHMAEYGYCIGCGNFYAGTTEFDFKHPGWCDNCYEPGDEDDELGSYSMDDVYPIGNDDSAITEESFPKVEIQDRKQLPPFPIDVLDDLPF